MKRKLILLGTGNAMAIHCYNTCFALPLDNGEYLLTDAGGGNGILRRLEAAQIGSEQLRWLFLTHAHTDHILGVIWIVRLIASLQQKGAYTGVFHIYTHDVAAKKLETMLRMLLKKKDVACLGTGIVIDVLADGGKRDLAGTQLSAFDIHSTKEKQFGYELTFADGLRLTCLGDEPYAASCYPYAADTDWLLSEAFCLDRDADRFKPYEKHHSTVKDAALTAAALGARHLILYHTEDKTLATRKARYTAEAQQYYDGPVWVPDDLESVELL